MSNWTRRAILAASTALTGLLAGCQSTNRDTNEDVNDGPPRCFNENDELTADVNNKSTKAERAEVGTDGEYGPPYNLISNRHQTVTVPGDYSTIQDAIDDCPKFLRHLYVIDVDPSNYDLEEDLIVRGVMDQATYKDNGEHHGLRIIGDTDTPSNVLVNTFQAVGCAGVESPQVLGVSFSGDQNPEVDEDVCVSVNGCTEAWFRYCEFRDGTAANASQTYTSRLHFRNTDFGVDNFESAILGKRESFITMRWLSGSVTGPKYKTTQLATYLEEDGTLTGDGYDIDRGGLVMRGDGTSFGGADRVVKVSNDQRDMTQSVPSGSWQTVEYNVVGVDRLGEWDSTNYEFTAATDGRFQVSYGVLFSESTPSSTKTESHIEGATRAAADIQVITTPDDVAALSASQTVELQEEDTIWVETQQNSGSSVDLSQDIAGTYLDINYISGLR